MLKSGKQVFMFFSNIQANPSSMDTEQLKAVKEFKERYGGKGLYFEYNSLDEFRKKIFNSLQQYYSNTLKVLPETERENQSDLSIKVNNDGEISNELIANQTYSNLDAIKGTDEINNKISINSSLNSALLELQKQRLDLTKGTYIDYNCEIPEDNQKILKRYCEKEEIELKVGFFDMHDLIKRTNVLSIANPFSGGNIEFDYVGDKLLENKYEAEIKLINLIKEYDATYNFYESINEIISAHFVICNDGKSYDETVIIKLIIDGNIIVKPNNLPFPKFYAKNLWESYDWLVDNIFMPKLNTNIEKYKSNNLFNPKSFDQINFKRYPINHNQEDDYEDAKSSFIRLIEEAFEYEFFFENGKSIIRLELKEIGPNIKISFPSLIFFSAPVRKIDYEITSKYNPDIIKGSINVIDEES
jgi:hypothetical protein